MGEINNILKINYPFTSGLGYSQETKLYIDHIFVELGKVIPLRYIEEVFIYITDLSQLAIYNREYRIYITLSNTLGWSRSKFREKVTKDIKNSLYQSRNETVMCMVNRKLDLSQTYQQKREHRLLYLTMLENRK